MESKYATFSLEELLEDKKFLAWAIRKENDREWMRFCEENPDFRTKAKEAREIIFLLRDSFDVLDENSVLDIWKNIDRFERLYEHSNKRLARSNLIKWAASVILVVSIGSIGYLSFPEKSGYRFSASDVTNVDEAKVLLSDGTEVLLTNDKSKIELNNQNEMIIDNDRVVEIDPTDDKVQFNKIVIPYGKSSELLLSDGTKVWLNAGSQLAFPSRFSGKTREIYLQGEACFKVAHNREQRFIVHAEDLDVEALGTWFNVSAYSGDNTIQTVLLEGSVSVQQSASFGFTKKATILEPYHKAEFNKAKREILVTSEPDASKVIAWTEGWFEFSRENLKTVLARLERYYNVEIIFPENYIASTELITGKLDLKDSLEVVMTVLADVAKIDYRISENKIYVNMNRNL